MENINIKIILEIKIQNFWCWPHFDSLIYLKSVHNLLENIYEENFIGSIMKQKSSKLDENAPHTKTESNIFGILGYIVSVVNFIEQKTL